ncbi:TetR/AcrR family transcriptional regulator [Paenibacillus protaetiae]|uniref:TetR/AcrR family transcriptional regulator n=1 Tax=Paenibacillus protaetiae TaxID=2509456 RepID=A0A4P6EZA9_9BACL|nr:TetR/AcrR family transcriptional regulator [Paenibacillus protaetiae]QAY67623.1 TetR/AcrR family transcriptional regulator [Paenibacillus protaetiae]
MPADKKPDRRVSRSKQGLKAALLELMEQKPFSSITTTEIVQRADFNRGTFYAHYEHKEALLDDIMNDLLKDLVIAFRKPYKHVDSFELSTLSASAVALFDHIYAHASLYKLMMDQRVLPGFREKVYRTMRETANHDLTPGQASVPERLNEELYYVYQYNALLGLAFHWIQEGFQHPPSYMAEQLVLFLNMRPSKMIVKHSG